MDIGAIADFATDFVDAVKPIIEARIEIAQKVASTFNTNAQNRLSAASDILDSVADALGVSDTTTTDSSSSSSETKFSQQLAAALAENAANQKTMSEASAPAATVKLVEDWESLLQ